MRLTLRYGDENNLQSLVTPTEFLPPMMLRGTKKLSRQQIQDELDKLQASLGANGAAGSATFNIQTKRDQLPAVLRLLTQILREPTLPASELEIMKRQQLAALKKSLKEPGALAQRKVLRTMYPYGKQDPRYRPTIEEEMAMVESLKPATLRRLYGQYLGGTHGELAVVGDFDREEILPILSEMLAGWSAEKPYERLRHVVNPNVKGGSHEILTPGKANAMYFAAMAFPVRDDDPDYAALVIGNFILGGGSLSSRLADRVRQTEGLSYSIGSGFQSRALDRRSAFYVYAICNPTNMEKLKTAIREEIQRWLKDGVTEDELQKAKQGYLQKQQVARTKDGILSSLLTSTTFANRDMQYYANLETKIRALTTDDIVAAARKHIDFKKLNIVAAGDLKK